MINRNELHNAEDMLRGCLNRLNVTDDPAEIETLYQGALYQLKVIKDIQTQRVQELLEYRENVPNWKSYE